jgi:hypothetical protein
MAELLERIKLWWEGFLRSLNKHKWWVLFGGPVTAFIWGAIEHRIFEFTNRFIDSHLSLLSLRPIARLQWLLKWSCFVFCFSLFMPIGRLGEPNRDRRHLSK